MERSDEQKEEWKLVRSRKRMETNDMQKEEWRLVISRKKNGDE